MRTLSFDVSGMTCGGCTGSVQRAPADYPWNARCAYFTDPDDTLWELYAWLEGGPGDYHDEQP